MGKFITMNFSGRYVIEGRKAVGKDAAGHDIYSEEIAICPTRLGVSDEGRKVIGFFDTETMLTDDQKENCEKKWGKDWLLTLDDKIQRGATNMRLLLPGETIAINGVDIQAANAGDAKRLPKSRRATIIQGPVTAAVMQGQAPSVRITAPAKVEGKMLPTPKERVRE